MLLMTMGTVPNSIRTRGSEADTSDAVNRIAMRRIPIRAGPSGNAGDGNP
jgi:hypothetical protein